MTHRTQTYLSLFVKKQMASLTPSDLHLSKDFEVRHGDEGSLWCTVWIKDPTEPLARLFEVRVKEVL